ncbi:hypothetical protein H632_c519p1 [Helicosporidium sp. ATCC 50920]|nr:hypothetical protein H632_c519p1 [Helicosporidium sp. ATCC 50920]|eukprot:KDD75746.1 hypothetical protein H632_c519p1 [Helicosporidium sp. ATCC 50920]
MRAASARLARSTENDAFLRLALMAFNFAGEDMLCKSCFMCVVRNRFGDDDDSTSTVGESVLISGWKPVIDNRLADDITQGRRAYFAHE